jgi:hypothetical protein
MSIRNRSWKCLFVLGLIMALFLVTGSTEVRAGSPFINITDVATPPDDFTPGRVDGTVMGMTGTPTFTVQLINADQPGQALMAPVVNVQWLSATHWRLMVEEPENLPNGRYNVRVRATFPNGVVLMDTTVPGGPTPDCSGIWCNCPC